MTTAHLLVASALLLIIISTFITLALIAYFAHREIYKIESILVKSKMVASDRIMLSNAGTLGKIFRLTSIAFLLMMPKLFTRKGLIDPDEIAQLPRKTRRQLKTIGYIYTTLTVAFLTSCVLSYFLPPLPK